MKNSFPTKFFLASILVLIFIVQPLKAQFNPLGADSPLQLDGQRGFFIMGGLALASVLATQFNSYRTQNYFSNQVGFYNDGFDSQGDVQILFQSVGLEKRLAPWFATSAEVQVQEMFGQNYANLGGSLMTYYRWHAFGKKKISPYFEYGAGIFTGIRQFPEDGTNFTFRLVYKLGAEWNFSKNSKVNKARIAYGHIHQSNNDLFARNPGYDGNGITFGLSWLLE